MRLHRIVYVAILITASLTGAWSQETGNSSYAFVNGKWFDGRTFVDRPFYSVSGLLHPNRPYKLDREIDLHGGYVIPACAEAHNHNATADNEAAVDRYLDSGILYVKNPANLPGVREGGRINRSNGIDVVFSNGVLTSSGGHPIGLWKRNVERGAMKPEDGEGSFFYTVDSLGDLEQKWPKVLATKPNFIKIILVYSEEFDQRKNNDKYFSRRGLDPQLIRPIVDRAHRVRLTVSAHVESATDFHHAVQAGVDEINHMPGFWPSDEAIAAADFTRYRISDADATTAGRKHIRVVTTLGEALDTIRSKPAPGMEQLLSVYRDNLAVLRKHRVTLLIGSDQFRRSARDEALSLAREKLFTNDQLLRSWCVATPLAIFPKRRVGELKDGYEANFVVLGHDPLLDFTAVQDVRLVFKKGEQIGPTAK